MDKMRNSNINIMREQNIIQENPLETFGHLFKEEINLCEGRMEDFTSGKFDLISKILAHIKGAGGKRMRPILLILFAKLLGYKGSEHIDLAACVEFLHTATLLHDDVVDGSDLRRGLPVANKVFGNKASILVGDFFLSRAFAIMADSGEAKIVKAFAEVACILTEGEVRQLSFRYDIGISERDYLEIISAKTAALFGICTKIASIIAKTTEDAEEHCYNFGKYFGMAFQISDDILDYTGTEQDFGKKQGQDFLEGKITLPVIYAYLDGTPQEKELIRTIFKASYDRTQEDFIKIKEILANTNSIQKCFSKAEEYIQIAKEILYTNLEDCEERYAVSKILDFSIERTS